MEFASPTEKEQLLHLFSIQPNDNTDKINSVKNIFNTTGASQATQKAIVDYTLIAFDTLQKIDIASNKKEVLKAFGEKLMGRKV
jgi:geranylgeranyl diphosphate synthase type II